MKKRRRRPLKSLELVKQPYRQNCYSIFWKGNPYPDVGIEILERPGVLTIKIHADGIENELSIRPIVSNVVAVELREYEKAKQQETPSS